ncbi:uncharacterized protein LOC129570392 isoform X1 [Sitodiplosis mosellana]|uniref:uncharacterized protein LOC129570392 isoform X1 n=1 Tax=Sitodiplosis mosellana TaxID=263140 RepID=UPI0024451CD2|nr:uncharacterized protein LOC129570392 isoform X1 [Sitodiplosis mosellana]
MGRISVLLKICVSMVLLSKASLADVNDDTNIKREINCTAVLIEAANKLSEPTSPTQEMAGANEVDYKTASSIYDFTVKDTYNKDVSLEKYRGHVVLIVNIASQCGLTKSNYAKLTQLKADYYDKGLRILGFPCNQFAGQMPEGDGDEMVCHLQKEKADFGDIFAKINVNGNSAIPLYKYLKEKQNGFFGSAIKWNFTKFLVDKNGIPVNRFAPTTDPMDIAKEIDKLL